MNSNAHVGAEPPLPTSPAAPLSAGPVPNAADMDSLYGSGQPASHSPEAEALIRRYLSEIHGYRQLGNAALRQLESRLAALSEPQRSAATQREGRSAAPSPLMQPSLNDSHSGDSGNRSLSQRLQELSAYLHADLTKREQVQVAQATQRDATQSRDNAQREDRTAAIEQALQSVAEARASRHASTHKVTPNTPVLDRAWFEERFAAMRASIDKLAEEIPTQRLDVLEAQFHQLMEKLDAREKDRSVAAVESGLKKLAAYLEDNKQWTIGQDERVRGVEARLDQLSGLVAQSHAALSATAKGLEIVARRTGPRLARETANLVTQQLEPRLGALDATAPINKLSSEVASLSTHSTQLARNTNERLKLLQQCLDESLERLAEVEKNQRTANSEAGQHVFDHEDFDDTEDYQDLPGAAQRAARLAGETGRAAASQASEPVHYRIPYGEFLPEEERNNSRIGLVVAAVILLLASAAMLYLNLRDRNHTASIPNAELSSKTTQHSKLEAMPVPVATASIAEKRSDRISASTPGFTITDGVGVTSVKADEISRTPASKDGVPGALTAAEPFDPQKSGQADTASVITSSLKTDSLGKAAVDGDSNAQFSVGENYLEGGDIEKQLPISERLSKAARWFRRAAENGHAPSQYRLATLYELGQGAPKDRAEAMLWYQRAAENGHIKAMHNLAVLSINGNGGASNYLTAAKWFTAAAEHGLRDSQYNLGILYERGLGVPKNPATAYLWFALAAKQGDAKALQKRDALAGDLTAAKLADADERIATWTPDKADIAANGKAPEPPVEQAGRGKPAILPKTPSTQLIKASWTTEVTSLDSIVAKAQRLLRKLGYQPGPVDGILGPRTVSAVRTFEQKSGLPATGKVTTRLVERMALSL